MVPARRILLHRGQIRVRILAGSFVEIGCGPGKVWERIIVYRGVDHADDPVQASDTGGG